MKKFKIWSIMMLVIMAFPVMVACGSDDSDDSSSVKRKLVGVWQTTMSSSNWKLIELKADGSIERYIYLEEGTIKHYEGSYTTTNNTHWIYNESDQTITMFRDDNYYNYIYKVSMSEDGNSWNGLDSATGKTYSFRRIKNQ